MTRKGHSMMINKPSQTPILINQEEVGKSTPRKRLKRKMAINHFVDSYLFPSIEIHIINKINCVSEIPKHSFNFNFEKIFKKLISTQLMGEFTSNFMLKMERYIRKIVEDNESFPARDKVRL